MVERILGHTILKTLRSFCSNLVLRYLARQNNTTVEKYLFFEWCTVNINYRETTITGMFREFNHIICVDIKKLFTGNTRRWETVESFKQFEYPNKKLGDNAIHKWMRGEWLRNDFHCNEMFGGDEIFVATNNAADAMMIMMLFGKSCVKSTS